MAITQIRGGTQIMQETVTKSRLVLDFLGGVDWDLTNGAKNATIRGLKAPVNADDAVNKGYADAIAAGFGPKRSVRLATAAELTATYNNGTAGVGATLTNSGTQAALTIDGKAAVVGDRVLVKNQGDTTPADALENGIYVVTNIGSGSTNWVLTRADDFDNNPDGEIRKGDFVPVEDGNSLKGYQFYLVDFDTGDVIGTDPITFSYFSNPAMLTAGDGIDIIANVISVDVTDFIDTNYGLTENTNDIRVNLTANGGLQFNAVGHGIEVVVDDSSINLTAGGALQVKPDGIKDTHIDWGTGAGQVSGVDVPLADAGGYFTTDNVEAALQEVGAKVAGTEVIGELPALDTGAETATLAHTPLAGSERVYLNGVRMIRGASYDYTITGNVITFTSPGLHPNDQVLVDYRY